MRGDELELPKRVGEYVLLERLAGGGMGTVYLGRPTGSLGFTRVVAIKRASGAVGELPILQMLADEAWLATRVEHPNVVRMLDVVLEQRELYLVMELVRGGSLALVQQVLGTPVPPAIAISITTQALAGLQAAHDAVGEQGQPLAMVHRDVSPQNLLIGVDGLVRVADFGIAKARSRLLVTKEGQLKGKLGYMAPEQIRGEPSVDRRADVYSAGVVLWEALLGRRVHDAASAEETLSAIMTSELPALPESVTAEAPGLEAVLRRAVAPAASDRFETAEAFQIALEECHSPLTSRALGSWLAGVMVEPLRSLSERLLRLESAPLPEQAPAAALLATSTTATHAGEGAPEPKPRFAAGPTLPSAGAISGAPNVSSPRHGPLAVAPRWISAAVAIVSLALGVATMLALDRLVGDRVVPMLAPKTPAQP